MISQDDPDAAKRALRERLLSARRARSAADRAVARSAVARTLTRHLAGCAAVAVYQPLPSEPLDPELLPQWHELGMTVLLPVVTGAAPLDWVRYPSPMVPGELGIATPTGPRLGPDALAEVDIVLVPALAVDPAGHRLGRGGGHYDRSLALAPGPRRLAVIFDDEWLDVLPAGPHDQPVHAAVSPGAGLRSVG